MATYLYQTLHTRRYQAPYLIYHCEALERCYMRLYARHILLDRAELASRIASLLRQNGVNEEFVTHIEMRLFADGSVELIITEKTIYEGYALRCYNPFAVCQTFDIPFGDLPTSVRRATHEWAHHIACEKGGDVAIRVGSDGVVYSCNGFPLFGVKGRTVFSSPAQSSVERSLGVYALQRCGYEFVEQPILEGDLQRFDELFWIDAYGLTAISQVESRRYMSIMAEKIARYIG